MASTDRGYDLHELLSALQKCIRRGLEYEALHFALELEAFGKSGPIILWNRLKIIACEDIGPANPLMPLLIDLLLKQYQNEKAKLGDLSDHLFLANAIVCLCRSEKSRITDDLLTIISCERKNNIRLSIPDFALDKHTKRGAMMSRGIEQFFSEGNKLEKETLTNPYTEKAKELLSKQ
ncbi:MAG: hypothetical protein GX638_09480 [Crenarchaeota archaeon]|nr:hypothetical protein [Thermoproteota archaeon]